MLDYVVPKLPSKPSASLMRHVVPALFFRFLCLSRIVRRDILSSVFISFDMFLYLCLSFYLFLYFVSVLISSYVIVLQCLFLTFPCFCVYLFLYLVSVLVSFFLFLSVSFFSLFLETPISLEIGEATRASSFLCFIQNQK